MHPDTGLGRQNPGGKTDRAVHSEQVNVQTRHEHGRARTDAASLSPGLDPCQSRSMRAGAAGCAHCFGQIVDHVDRNNIDPRMVALARPGCPAARRSRGPAVPRPGGPAARRPRGPAAALARAALPAAALADALLPAAELPAAPPRCCPCRHTYRHSRAPSCLVSSRHLAGLRICPVRLAVVP